VLVLRNPREDFQMTAARRQVSDDLPDLMTADEFFAMPDDGTGTRYQLVNGYLVAMAPAAPVHGLLQAELARLIGNHLTAKKGSCWVSAETGVQPVIRNKTNIRIPDLGVSCTPLRLDDKTMRDPVLLIEILSPSNEKQTEANIWMYASMVAVQEVLLVHTKGCRLELFRRRPNGQLADAEIADLGQSVLLGSIGMTLAVDALYGPTPLAGRAVKTPKKTKTQTDG
jgi:Uma2 family endonuclease